MKTLTTLFVGLLAISTFAAPAPKENADAVDLKKFDGNWSFTDWKHSGADLNAASLETAKWSVKGDKYTFEISGVQEEGTLKVDSSKKPAAFDLIITAGNDKGSTQLGIYKFDGETIIMCLARPGVKERPTEFTSTEDNANILVTIKKAK